MVAMRTTTVKPSTAASSASSSPSASSTSTSSSGVTSDELLKKLLDSVSPSSSFSGSSSIDASLSASASSSSDAAAATVTPTPTPSVSETSTTQIAGSGSASTGSGGGSSMGTTIGVVVGVLAVLMLVAFVYRSRKRKRAQGFDDRPPNNLGTPQLSIELPQPPLRRKDLDSTRSSGASSMHHRSGGESLFHVAGEVSPSMHGNQKLTLSAYQYRSSEAPPTANSTSNMTYQMLGESPLGDRSERTSRKLLRIASGRVDFEAEDEFKELRPLPPARATAKPPALDASVNSLHDSACSDLFKQGDGLGRAAKLQNTSKSHPTPLMEDFAECSPIELSIMTPVNSAPNTPKRPPPPPPPAGVIPFVPPRASLSSSQVSTTSSLSGSRLSTASNDSANDPRAGSLISLVQIASDKDGSKEIEI